jgi:septum formation protein
VIKSGYEERHESCSCPRELVLKHACGKLAEARVPKNARWVVAADTVVALDGRVYGKPSNLKQAVRMLSKLAGRTHEVYTGWAMLDALTGRRTRRVVRSRVTLRALSVPQIRTYFKKMNPLDKAGAYAIQSKPSVVESIQGSYSNVMGFPMEDFEKTIKRLSLRPKR